MRVFIYILYAAALVYTWLIIARAVLSWFPVGERSPVYHIKAALYALTEPYLGLFRRFLPFTRIGSIGLDLSAIAGLVVLFLIIQLLIRI